ncbi:MAG: proton-conducting transporter membrane subunit [Anaerolineales bacterium]
MNAVLLLLGMNGLIGLTLMALHNQRKISWYLATVSAILLGAITLLAPLDEALSLFGAGIKLEPTFRFLGRRFIIDGSNRAAIGYIYLAAAFLFGGGWVARANRFFYSGGTFSLLAIVLSLMVQPFLYAAIFQAGAALAMVFVLVDPRRPAIQAALRLLLFYILGMMAILMAGWLLDTSGVTAAAPALVERVIRFLAVGFGVLLIVPPFHLWLPAAADSAQKYSVAFVPVLLYSTGLFVLLRFMNEFEWMRSSMVIRDGLRAAGMFMVVLGGLWAVAQRDLARAMVYLLLADFGASMILLGSPAGGYSLALVMAGARIISVGVWGVGITVLERVIDRGNVIAGSAYSNPLPSAAAVVGLISLGGLPLTAGFPARWGGIQLVGGDYFAAAVILILGIALAAATAARWIWILLSEPEEAPITAELLPLEKHLIRAGIGLCISIGIFPQLLFPWISQALAGLDNLIR